MTHIGRGTGEEVESGTLTGGEGRERRKSGICSGADRKARE